MKRQYLSYHEYIIGIKETEDEIMDDNEIFERYLGYLKKNFPLVYNAIQDKNTFDEILSLIDNE